MVTNLFVPRRNYYSIQREQLGKSQTLTISGIVKNLTCRLQVNILQQERQVSHRKKWMVCMIAFYYGQIIAVADIS